MNTSTSITDRKWRNRRNQSFGSMTLALNYMKKKFNKKSIRLAKYRQKLHASKVELRHRISELQRLEFAVINDQERYRNSLALLEEELSDVRAYCTNHPTDKDIPELLNQHDWIDVDIHNGREHIRRNELDLSTWNNLVTPAKDNLSESSHTSKPVPVKIQIYDIDASGTIEESCIDIENDHKCCMCLKNYIDCVLYKCGHQCCCSTCAKEIQQRKDGKCPACHLSIQKVIKTYNV